jgi:hypothetical protein
MRLDWRSERTAWCFHRATSTASASLRSAALGRHLAHELGSAPTEVAAWAGHSVEVLMGVYAKCMTGLEDVWIGRMDDALHLEDPEQPE